MSGFLSELEEKKAEAEQLLEIISEVSNGESAISKAAILKSAFVLLLYNMVESTAFLVFEKIHEKIAIEHYARLGTKLRMLWVEFFFSKNSPSNHHGNLEGTLQQTLQFPSLEEFMGRIKLFSGNLDARQMDNILSKYGVGALTTPDKGKLLTIKTRRNALAHGEQMFKEACRDLGDSDLVELKNAAFNALDDLVGQAEAYLNEKKYLAPLPA